MASSIIFICLFIGIFTSPGISEVTLQCNPVNVGYYGQQSLLNCVIQSPHGVAQQVKIDTVVWKKEGNNTPVLVYDKTKGEKKTVGYSFAEPSWNETKNVSLLIMDTALAHHGKYTCKVFTTHFIKNCSTVLEVRARYNQPIIHSTPKVIDSDTDSKLICESDGGFPGGTIRWFDEHKTDWTKSAKNMKVEKMDSGLFHLSSELPLKHGSTFSEYTCVVYNATGGIETQNTFPLAKTAGYLGYSTSDKATKVVAPLVVIGSLIVGLLILLVYKKRSRHTHRVPEAVYDEEEGEHQEMKEPLQTTQPEETV